MALKKVITAFCLMVFAVSFAEATGIYDSDTNAIKSNYRFCIMAGLGAPELFHAGLRYSLLKQLELGANVGGGQLIFTASADAYFHAFGKSRYTAQKPWFFLLGISYLRDNSYYETDKYAFLNARLGRNVNFSPRWGFNAELGAVYQLMHENVVLHQRTGWNFNFQFPFLPSIGLSLFYRI